VALCHDLVRVLVVEDELEVPELGGEPPPVPVEDVPVPVVLGPDLGGERPGAGVELRPIARGDDLQG
jgi:hypothetical protein